MFYARTFYAFYAAWQAAICLGYEVQKRLKDPPPALGLALRAKKQIFIKTSDEEVIPARQAKMQETLGSLGGRVDLTTQALKSCRRHREVESDPGQKGQLVPVMAH
ncbi:hypothetical protein HPB47_013571 [Ixodes persulcatus]|uniref:Uncharacterized protein n=1 Tax=Ixodes persulcatus TaxID=34615 RepID=A0AC60QZ59_IXOPE|nr:hypothetical protein HPB47_013571 [Ixodes persulcatus]